MKSIFFYPFKVYCVLNLQSIYLKSYLRNIYEINVENDVINVLETQVSK